MSSNILDTPESRTSPQAEPARYITFEEYLMIGEDTDRTEWVDGEVIWMAPTSADHQRLSSFLEKIMGLFVEMHDLGEVFRSPFVIKLESQRRGREPDILFVRKERSQLIKKNFLDGPADLAVEVISPDSVRRDRREKYGEYEAAGIEEYWLLDPERRTAEFYVLTAEQRYELALTPEGVFSSKVLPGFFLRLDWLWQTPSPTFGALRELKLIS